MILPVLAMLPTIFSAISGASELFESGRKAVAAITGNASEASTPEELEAEIKSLPEAQQGQWLQKMEGELERYKAETNRIDIEGGRIDSNITSKLSGDAADRIAVLRQSTRPWAVRMSMHFILLPVYLAIIDVGQGLLVEWIVQPIGVILRIEGMPRFQGFSAFKSVFGVSAGAAVADGKLSSTVIGLIYTSSVGWLSGIVVAYMGLREIGKARGTSGDDPEHQPQSQAGQLLSQAGGVADQITKVVNKVREVARKF